MPREASASLRLRNGKFSVRAWLGAGRRILVALPTCSSPPDPQKAEERRALLADLARRLRPVGRPDLAKALLERAGARDGKALAEVCAAIDAVCAGGTEPTQLPGVATFGEFAERWTSGELRKLYPDHVADKASVKDDEWRLGRHVYPIVETVPLAAFSLDHAEAVMRALPATLSAASRRHVAQLMHRILSLAVFPARIIKANPLPRGFLPKPGTQKAMSYVYPDEDQRLLRSAAVPLCYRVLYGLLAREGLRADEAASLTWEDLDLERGALVLDENKTDEPRAWALSPDVAAALSRWRDMDRPAGANHAAPGGHVFTGENGERLNVDRGAERFRGHLRAAGVTREVLFERSPARRPIRVHDLRATFITISLANGKTETWIADRTGHRSSVMINRYRRPARQFGELRLGTLAPLDESIPELAPKWPRSREPEKVLDDACGEKSAPSADWCTRGDSNPQAFRRRNLKPQADWGAS